MKKIFAFLKPMFKQKWLISLLGLVALAVLVWFAGPFVAFGGRTPLASPMIRLLVILVLVLLWGLDNLRRQIQANRASEEIAQGLVEPSAAPIEATAESEEELAALKARFEEALAILRKSGGRRGKRSLYELPWYIIIGPPGCGKTTALVNSGLRFPLSEQFGREAVRGVGGTRNCDWWFTNEAVLLDTAGRYTTQDSHAQVDRTAWEGFLGLLKKHRRRRPINGVLVAASLAELMTLSETERRLHVNAVKQRLKELHEHLAIQFPVYLVFTKCDLVAGFMEFFEDLGRDERAQVWGVTFPLESGETGVIQRFGAEFDTLMESLNGRLLRRLHQERDVRRRSLILGFPQQMNSLKTLVDGFLQDIFRPSRFEELHILRGVYFTSGTQEGTPIDRLMGSLATIFGLDRQALPSHSGHGRSYFITNLLKRVIFPEAELVGVDRRLERQRAWLQRAAYVGCFGLAVLAALAWSTSYTANRSYVDEVRTSLEDHRERATQPLPTSPDFLARLPRLDALQRVVKTATQHAGHVPWRMGFFLYQGNALGDAASDAYVRELNGVLLPAIAARMEQQLRGTADNPDLQYETLKVYLMLGMPDRLDEEWLQGWVHDDWEAAAYSAADRGRLESHLGALLDGGMDGVPLDERLVRDVRSSLRQAPLATLVYGRLKREALETDEMPFRVADALRPDGDRVFGLVSKQPLSAGVVPGFLTYRGYYEVFRRKSAELAERMRDESWVLGLDRDQVSQAELEELEEGLEERYVGDYVGAWDRLLNDMRIVSFETVQQGKQVLEILAGPTSPLRSLLEAVERNTSLSRPPEGDQSLREKAGTGKTVERHFAELHKLVRAEGAAARPIDRLKDMLSDLYAFFIGLESDDVTPDPQSPALQRLRGEAVLQPEPVKTWLLQLVGSSEKVVENRLKRREEEEERTAIQQERAELNKHWQEVRRACTALVDRYPFDKKSPEDVPLEDFGRLFARDGALNKFYSEHLRQLIDTSREPWQWRPKGVALGVPDDVLRQFQRAEKIRKAFFQADGQIPSIRFDLKPLSLDAQAYEFVIELDGQRFRYRHGPALAKSARWPQPESPGLVRMELEDTGGQKHHVVREGPWAWFRALDESTLQVVAPDRLKATFEVGGRTATYEIQASSVVNPFSMGELQSFRCPESM